MAAPPAKGSRDARHVDLTRSDVPGSLARSAGAERGEPSDCARPRPGRPSRRPPVPVTAALLPRRSQSLGQRLGGPPTMERPRAIAGGESPVTDHGRSDVVSSPVSVVTRGQVSDAGSAAV
jgi:hypothetical protein